MPTSYVIQIAKAEELKWQASVLHSTPSPSADISLDGNVVLTTTTKTRTFSPRWKEEVDITPKSTSSPITISVYHETTAGQYVSQIGSYVTVPGAVKKWIPQNPGTRRLIGSVSIKVQDLMKKTRNEEKDVPLEIFLGSSKTGIAVVRFLTTDPPITNKPAAATKVVPPELSPDYTPPTSGGYKMQVAGFREKEVDISQSERIVQQILARAQEGPEDIA